MKTVFDEMELIARKSTGRRVKHDVMGNPSAEQCVGCVTCVKCKGFPAVVFWPRGRYWSIYCYCSTRSGVDAGTRGEAVKLWNKENEVWNL
jgi:hypothetical protein